MSDELDVVRMVRPRVEATDPARLSRVRSALMASVRLEHQRTDEGGAAPVPKRRRRRPLTAVLVALGMTASATAAAAWMLTRADETTRIACPDDTFISAVSGDPVADCAREWRDRGEEPPAMTAYEDDHGRVAVVRDGDPVPRSWRRLEAGFRQDARAIELEERLSDQIAGVSSTCLSTDEARAVVKRQLTELGLQGWSIAEKREDADGETSCAYASLEDRTVTLLSISDMGTPPQWVTALSGDVRGAVSDHCLSAAEAADAVRDAASRRVPTDIATHLSVRSVVDDRPCATATWPPGGAFEVIVRGPRAAPR